MMAVETVGSSASDSNTPAKIAIHVSAKRGLIYAIEDVQRLREEFHICGTLIGILPQVPQQNVFQGLPLELMPEEIRYLVEEKDAAYLVDNARVHDLASFSFDTGDKEKLDVFRKERGEEQIRRHREIAEVRRKEAVEKAKKKKNGGSDKDTGKESGKAEAAETTKETAKQPTYESGTFYDIDTSSTKIAVNLPFYDLYVSPYKTESPIAFTSTSDLISKPIDVGTITVPPIKLPTPAAYAMYKHMQSKGYYLSPGFRFGGQFLAYPGDPLRYHSHHIAIGYDWDQKFGVLDIVGGGRLGTAVKKCWYVGAEGLVGETEAGDEASSETAEMQPEFHGFSVEWSGFG